MVFFDSLQPAVDERRKRYRVKEWVVNCFILLLLPFAGLNISVIEFNGGDGDEGRVNGLRQHHAVLGRGVDDRFQSGVGTTGDLSLLHFLRRHFHLLLLVSGGKIVDSVG